MKVYTIILIIVMSPYMLLLAQNDCADDDLSCQHTKAMLLEASEAWETEDNGINTNDRSTKLDILNYKIVLDMTQFDRAYVNGSCTITCTPKVDSVSQIKLDLLQMEVGDILWRNRKLTYRYNDTILTIRLDSLLMLGDTTEITVEYNGSPQKDAQWGGFYYKGDYAYNMGVGFASNPHNYGRVWHPCFDNFAERATYTFVITTNSIQRAHCNGYLQSEHTADDKTTRTWKLKTPIPSYLACIAVGDYITVKEEHKGVAGIVPIELAANKNDTANLNASFEHLKDAIAAYEYWYGPHRWSKVGYALVPFRSGAMEHATNIAYPINAVDGTLKKESLMAHELGHSWWGNLVTCETANDMWINEGMASYSEHLFSEYVYGRKRYLKEVKDNHHYVFNSAHRREGGYRPISGVPHKYTYGMHVYNKGAVVAHNLRGYLGDSLFRKGLHHVTETFQFQNMNSPQFRDALSAATGVDLTPFFDDWVFRGGYPHFCINNKVIEATDSGTYSMNLEIAQTLVGRTIPFSEVPLQLSCYNENKDYYTTTIQVGGLLDTVTVDLPFEPITVILNEGHLLNQARFDASITLNKRGAVVIKSEGLDLYGLYVKEVRDSAWMHLEHHAVAPNHTTTLVENSISDQHYWSIHGVGLAKVEAVATIAYNSRTDKAFSERTDSLILWYRPTKTAAWQPHPCFLRDQRSETPALIFSLLAGDYALGIGDPTMIKSATKLIAWSKFDCQQKNKHLELNLGAATRQNVRVGLYGMDGKLLVEQTTKLVKRPSKIQLPTKNCTAGIYFIKIYNQQGQLLNFKKVHLE